ncbi:MAG: flagellar protein FhlB [Gammaproteobacteria bacterium]|jgi:flagellar biosynthesis protein|nr:flagellar protein FhlB [Gammaproteobacteria bacterium]MBT3722641.1 flagellar protein FhlB [Gammaproteobacteria bacterium]MBT4076502.1 flagellar protein FhlB [Gammaproteobacteria bacterium]MBT4193039.1 flagellar protein FhlB [Gammaproteobacteria bacterium]MBT4451058.1 flagellar protein FhlB [Gammaproteobacteria bacterium]
MSKKDKKQKPRFAIALEYDGEQAPVVTAKGHQDVAEEILTIAEQESIPVYEDKELSALLDQLDLGDHIPQSLYVVIAEVLSFAYRLSGKHKDFMDKL